MTESKSEFEPSFSWRRFFMGLFTLRGFGIGLVGLALGAGVGTFVGGLPVALGFFLVAWLLGLIAFASDRSSKQCPDCKEWVEGLARVCKHCGHRFGPVRAAGEAPPNTRTVWRCSECGTQVPRSYDECPKCGRARSDEPLVAWTASG